MLQPLLIEVGTEELPPQNLNEFVQRFAQAICAGLKEAGITPGRTIPFVTPRRLAVLIDDVPEKTPARKINKRGPTLASSYDDKQQPSKALLGFAKSCNVPVESLSVYENTEGAWMIYEHEKPGQNLTDFLGKLIEDALKSIPVPKSMRWGDNEFSFVRPIHWITVVHGQNACPVNVFNLQATTTTYGHRFHAPRPLTITHASDYAEILKNAYVIAAYDERKALILSKIEQLAQKLQGKAHIIPELLDMVTGLVEWPQALSADFSKDFLEVPQEALISSMQNHQKCFALYDQNSKLKNTFILISNIAAADDHLIRQGNERVMQARLSDAKFFYDQDRKVTLVDRMERLKKMVFQKNLGSLYDKSVRISKLAYELSKLLGANPQACERAGKLCKADLVTEMIFEFPELQGIMGYYYALNDGEPEEVAVAIKESYYPRFAKDKLPSSLIGTIIGLADRLDTLIGIFGIGQVPTGDKDPYGLRRQAVAILRIIIEKQLLLDVEELLTFAKHGYGNLVDNEVITNVLNFCQERFRAWSLEQDVSPQVVDSVLATCTPVPYDCSMRIKAVSHFQTLTEAQALSSANKRVRNILQKSGLYFNLKQLPALNFELLTEKAEKDLAEALEKLQLETEPLIANRQYQDALVLMASLQPIVDAFFNDVMVMTEDEAVRKNRLLLLAKLQALFSRIADISKLAL